MRIGFPIEYRALDVHATLTTGMAGITARPRRLIPSPLKPVRTKYLRAHATTDGSRVQPSFMFNVHNNASWATWPAERTERGETWPLHCPPPTGIAG